MARKYTSAHTPKQLTPSTATNRIELHSSLASALSEISPVSHHQADLLALETEATTSIKLMTAIDHPTKRFGRGASRSKRKLHTQGDDESGEQAPLLRNKLQRNPKRPIIFINKIELQ